MGCEPQNFRLFARAFEETLVQSFRPNVKNLFDKVYAASGFSERTGHFPGEPRRVYVQAAYAF